MIPANQAHALSTSARERIATGQLLSTLQNVERQIMKATAEGAFFVSITSDELFCGVPEFEDALLALGYSVQVGRRRKGVAPIQIAWGGAEP